MDEYLRDDLIMIRRAHIMPGGGGVCRGNYPSACDVCVVLRMLDKADAVIAAVKARRAADAEYDHAGDDYVRGKIKVDALGVAYYACKRARETEDTAVVEWEKLNNANQSNAT